MRLLLLLVVSLLLFVHCFSATGAEPAASSPEPVRTSDDGKTAWYDALSLNREGQGWTETAAPYDRLPARAKDTVREAVWNLSRHSAGICIRFASDASQIDLRWSLISSRLDMPHMPATGVSGVDLYVHNSGRWRWLANGRPTSQQNEVTLVAGLPVERREYLLYLPLYNGVSQVEIGLPATCDVESLSRPKSNRRPIVFYGTSITQGGCASRPGMVHTAILGRRLDRPVINLGFSGNGRLEIELARLLAELDASVFVIDCLPNTVAQQVKDRTEPLVREIRSRRPDTPILLVEDRSYTDSFLLTSKQKRNQESRRELVAAHKRLEAAGVTGLYYLGGEELLGDDGEATVDSSHPTDLGFVRMADAFEPVLREILGE